MKKLLLVFLAAFALGAAPEQPYNQDSKFTEAVRARILNGKYNVAMVPGITGAGSTGSPWVGFESEVASLVAAGKDVYFPEGVYSTTTGITLTGGKIALTGAGPEKTVIKCAGTGACLTINHDFGARVDLADMQFYLTSSLSSGFCAMDGSVACTSDGDCTTNAGDQCIKAVLDIGNEGKTCSGGADSGEVCTTGATCESGSCLQGLRSIDAPSFRNIKVSFDTTAHATGATAIRLTNANNGVLDGVQVEGDSGQFAGWKVALDLFPGEKQNRGNLTVLNGDMVKNHTCVRLGYGATIVNNVSFYGTKCVSNLSAPAATDIGWDIWPGADVTTLDNTHGEAYGRSIRIVPSRGGVTVRNHWFGHMAGNGSSGGNVGPDGIGLEIMAGRCSGSAYVACNFTSECSALSLGTCTQTAVGEIEVTGSRFEVSANGGSCSWCSNAPSTTCTSSSDCSGNPCNLTCGMAVRIGTSSTSEDIQIHGNEFRNVRLRIGQNTHCSATTGTLCDANSDCPTNEQCVSSSYVPYGNTWLGDDEGFFSITRGATSDQSGAMLRLVRQNSNAPAIDLVDGFSTTQIWQINGDDGFFTISDQTGTPTNPFRIATSSNQVQVTGDQNVPAFTVTKTGGTGAAASIVRTADFPALDIIDYSDAGGADSQTWRFVPDTSEDMTLQDMTNGSTPVVQRWYNGGAAATCFPGRVGIGNADIASAKCISPISGSLWYDADCDAANDVGTDDDLATDDDTPESGDFTNLTGGAGITNTAGTLATASTEAAFLTDGAAVDLTCGSSNQGKMQVLDDGQLQWCDGATTSVLRRAAYGDSSGNATTGDSATAFFSAGAIEVARGGNGAAPGADDQVMVSDSTSAGTFRSIPNCTDSGGNHLNYTASTNSFSCGTTGDGAGSVEVQDEAYSSTNFNGDTASAVSQDDFYDYAHIGDTDDDGKADVLDSTITSNVQITGTVDMTNTVLVDDADFVIEDGAGGSASFRYDVNGTNAMTFAMNITGSDKVVTLQDASTTLMGRDTTDTMTNKTLNVEGTGNDVTFIVEEPMYFSAQFNGAQQHNTNASGTVPTGSAISQSNSWPSLGGLNFAENADARVAWLTALPATWSASDTTDLSLYWRGSGTGVNCTAECTPTTACEVKWCANVACSTPGTDGADLGSLEETETCTLETIVENYKIRKTTFTLDTSGCTAGDMMYVYVRRKGDDAADDYCTSPSGRVTAAYSAVLRYRVTQ